MIFDEFNTIGAAKVTLIKFFEDLKSEVPMSPLSVVHVRQDFEVTRVDASQHTYGDKLFRHQTSFD